MTQLVSQELSDPFAAIFPDGKYFICYATGAADIRDTYFAELGQLQARRIMEVESSRVYTLRG